MFDLFQFTTFSAGWQGRSGGGSVEMKGVIFGQPARSSDDADHGPGSVCG